MKNTTNYSLRKPEGTDVINVDDFNGNADIIDKKLKELELNEIFYAVATGSANTYAVTISALSSLTGYVDGLAVCVKINVVSTGASTININGWGAKSIVDSLGNPITNGGLKANTPYTLRYNGSVFILQGKGGGGNVTADKLLIGYTATSDTGQVNGAMANNGTINITPGATAKSIPKGYTDGGTVAGDSNLISDYILATKSIFGIQGKVSVVDTADALATASQLLSGVSAYVNGLKVIGSMVNNGAVTITPGATAKTIPAGYHNGSGTVATDSNLLSGNIRSGISIFGVSGKSTVVDTADAVLDPAYLVNGYSGYDDGVKKAGTLPNLGASQQATDTWTDGNGTLVFRVPSIGAFTSNVNNYKPEVTKYDGNFIPSSIVSGKNIFGINGSATPTHYATGTALSTIYNSPNYACIINISGLIDFTPDLVLSTWNANYTGQGAFANFTGFGPSFAVWFNGGSSGWKLGNAGIGSPIVDPVTLFGPFDSAHIPLCFGASPSYANKTVTWKAYKFT